MLLAEKGPAGASIAVAAWRASRTVVHAAALVVAAVRRHGTRGVCIGACALGHGGLAAATVVRVAAVRSTRSARCSSGARLRGGGASRSAAWHGAWGSGVTSRVRSRGLRLGRTHSAPHTNRCDGKNDFRRTAHGNAPGCVEDHALVPLAISRDVGTIGGAWARGKAHAQARNAALTLTA